MKIAFVHKDINTALNAGGINTVYLKHIEELEKLGVETLTITSREGPWNFKGKRYIVENTPDRSKKIYDILETEKPEIVDVFSWGAELLDYVKKPHFSKVVMRADIPMKFYNKPPLDEEMVKYCDKVVSISRWCDFEWSSVVGHKTKIIPHACDKACITNIIKEPNSVVWIGKATDTKGFDILLNLPKDFYEKYNLTVICAKTKFSDENLFKKLTDNGARIVENLSNEEYYKILAKSDFVLSTARREGFCIAVLEAMIYKAIPIIPYWIGGTTDFVNKKNGIIFEDIGNLTKLLDKINNKELLQKECQKTAEKYNWPDIVKQSYNMYKELMDE